MGDQNYKNYDLGETICIDDVLGFQNITIGTIVHLMYQTDGVDDKIYFTISSKETGLTIFSGRNMHLYNMPIQLMNAKVVAIDDVGDDNQMNFIISTEDWILKPENRKSEKFDLSV